MYSRNYGFTEDTPSKITPPPDYGGSAIRDENNIPTYKTADESSSADIGADVKTFSAPFEEERQKENYRFKDASENQRFDVQNSIECSCGEKHEKFPEKEKCRKSPLAGFSAEDIILMGIIAALAFGVADKDILIIALVITVVLM